MFDVNLDKLSSVVWTLKLNTDINRFLTIIYFVPWTPKWIFPTQTQNKLFCKITKTSLSKYLLPTVVLTS